MTQPELTLKTVENLSAERKEPFWLKDKRLNAFKTFVQTPLAPEDKLSNIPFIDFSAIKLAENKSTVFMASDKAIAFEDLNIALKKYPDLIKEKLMTTCVNALESKFCALHFAFWNEGAFLFIPKNTDAGTLHLVTGMSSASKFENILVVAEEGAKATIIEKCFSENHQGYRSQIVEIFLGNNSEITYAGFQDTGKGAVNVSIKRALLGKDAIMTWVDCNAGGSFTVSEVSTIHAGNGARSKTFGAFFGEDKQRFEFTVNSYHKAADTECRMVARGMLKDRAKSLYYGLIDIDKNGARTNGYQREDALLLGNNAEANAIPKLQIKNNDVKCSHGTAIGQIDQEKLFYLLSRGISEEDSKKLIVDAFFEPLFKEIQAEQIVSQIKDVLARKNTWHKQA